MAEENDTPGREPTGPAEGTGERRTPGRIEGDLLAERRALRAAESGEAALLRRAEAAEATALTLERHVVSLQQRLGEAEEERGRLADLLEAERIVAVEREHELRRVKQREYAEQQLRVEAEERLIGADREGRSDLEQLARRLSASERDANELAGRLEGVQRQLAEAEQRAAAERSSARRADGDVQARLSSLESHAAELRRGLEGERAARERTELLLGAMQEGHRRMEDLLGDVRGILSRLAAALVAQQAATPVAPPAPAWPPAPVSPSAPVSPPAPVSPFAPVSPSAPAPAPALESQPAPASGHAAAPAGAPAPQPAPVADRVQGVGPAAAPADAPAERAGGPAAGAGPSARTVAPRPPGPELERPMETGAREHGEDMAAALAAAVERLRARAEAVPAPAPTAAAKAAVERPAHVPHKHSMSLITRWRIRRKQRRGR